MHQIESFFWGIIAALGALTMQLVLYIGFSFYLNPDFSMSFSQIFAIPAFLIVGAFTEELFKYIIIAKRIETFSLEKSYIINSLLVGLGFFSVEAGLAMLNSTMIPRNSLIEIAIIHIGTAGIIGYLVATKNPKKIGTFIIAALATTSLHSAYNYLVTSRNSILDYLIYAILAVIIFFNIINFFRISSKLAQD